MQVHRLDPCQGNIGSPGVRGAVTAREAADPLLLALAGSSVQSGPADLLHRCAGVGRKGGAQRLASCSWDALVCHHQPMISVLGLVPWSCTGLQMQPSLSVLLSLLVQDIRSRCCSIWESCLRPGCLSRVRLSLMPALLQSLGLRVGGLKEAPLVISWTDPGHTVNLSSSQWFGGYFCLRIVM